jgi:hypothetical protein
VTGVAPEPADRAIARVLAGGLADTRTPTTPVCANCLDTGYACEAHPGKAWDGMAGPHPDACNCEGEAGMPCTTCCDPAPEDGTASITDAFTPRHLRG